MSRALEIPDELYDDLEETASVQGTTPEGWIAAHLQRDREESVPGREAASPKTLAQRFAGRTGRFRSGGKENLSEDTGETFTDYLEAKRRAGQGRALELSGGWARCPAPSGIP